MADLVISRAGANAICELLALKKPNILIPLPASSSRGDQLLNAKSFESQGFSLVINEDDLTTELLLDRVHELYFSRQTFRNAMSDSGLPEPVRELSLPERFERAIYLMDKGHIAAVYSDGRRVR